MSEIDGLNAAVERLRAETKDAGYPAFPLVVSANTAANPGMLLRDYFAAKLLPVIWAESTAEEPMSLPEIATEAYRMADAMLAERAKRGGR